MRRGRAPFQHVEPPGIVGEMHADMVGHEIEDQAEIVLLQRRAQPLEAGLAAELGIEPGVIDDVIAVGAALARLQEGRGIEMADAERLQIGHDGGGRVEAEICGQLQAVGRDRNGRRHHRCSDAPEHRPWRKRAGDLAAPDRRARGSIAGCGRCRVRTDWRSSRSVAPSPMRQCAVSRPLSAACASPKRAPASRGTISRRRIASSSRTSVSRSRPPASLRASQSSTADCKVDASSGSGTSSPYLA